jgi:CBS domain-containing protein
MHCDESLEAEGKDNMRVKDIMSTPAQTCRPDTDLGTVARMMWEHDYGCIPVIGSAETVLGLVTDRDICIATATRRLPPCHIRAAQAMSNTVHSCVPDDGIDVALSSMKQFKVRRLPVVDSSGAIKGVISMNDIVRAAGTRPDVPVKDVIGALAEICEPRRVAVTVE